MADDKVTADDLQCMAVVDGDGNLHFVFVDADGKVVVGPDGNAPDDSGGDGK